MRLCVTSRCRYEDATLLVNAFKASDSENKKIFCSRGKKLDLVSNIDYICYQQMLIMNVGER